MKRVSSIILTNKNRFLMHLRDNKSDIPNPNYWSFIGGEIEEGENPLQGIERECLEEIGIKPINIKLIDKIFIPPNNPSENDEVFIFKGEIDKEVDEIILTEGQKVEYFYFDDIFNLKLPAVVKKFILENKNKLF